MNEPTCFVDANVFVRYLTADDAQKAEAVEQLLVYAKDGDVSFPISLLPEKGLQKVESNSHASKDKRHPEPDFSGDGHLSFNPQVIPEGDTKEDDCYGHEYYYERWRALHGLSQVLVSLGIVLHPPLYFNPRICFGRKPGARTSKSGWPGCIIAISSAAAARWRSRPLLSTC